MASWQKVLNSSSSSSFHRKAVTIARHFTFGVFGAAAAAAAAAVAAAGPGVDFQDRILVGSISLGFEAWLASNRRYKDVPAEIVE